MHFHAHDHHHHHDHGHHDHGPVQGDRRRLAVRLALAALVAVGAALAAASTFVEAGQALVVTRFGAPVRVLTRPGLAWRLPAPIEGLVPVDLRLRTTSTGLQDVGTREGLRILVQAYAAWQVADDPQAVRQYVRAVRDEPDEAARQLRRFLAAALQTTASSFDLADLVDTDTGRLRLPVFEERLRAAAAPELRRTFGLTLQQVGIERLSLPAATLSATVARMRAERETVAAARTAEGLRAAAQIRADAERDSRISIAAARTEAAGIEAAARQEAASIAARSYLADPSLYLMLRSLDTIGAVMGSRTRLILRTDAPPFDALVTGPEAAIAAPPRGALAAAAPADTATNTR